MLATIQIRMIVDLWKTQTRRQHQCQQSKSAFGGHVGNILPDPIKKIPTKSPFKRPIEEMAARQLQINPKTIKYTHTQANAKTHPPNSTPPLKVSTDLVNAHPKHSCSPSNAPPSLPAPPALKLVIHAVASYYLPLNGYTGPGCGDPEVGMC